MKILIVEDEEGLREALIRTLTGEGYLADGAADGDEGYRLICTGLYDLVLLDIMLPVYDGLEVFRRIRKQGLDVPVILLTARSTVEDKVGGMDLGADDYLTKPFAMPELLARIRMVARRGSGSAADHGLISRSRSERRRLIDSRRLFRAVRSALPPFFRSSRDYSKPGGCVILFRACSYGCLAAALVPDPCAGNMENG